MSTPSPSADRNLIFGLLALEMDFVTREQLIDALHAWMLEKHRPLGQVLQQRGVLTERRVALLDGLVQEHVAQHGSDPQASLAALRVEPAVRQDLDRLNDPDVQASMASLTPESGTLIRSPVASPAASRVAVSACCARTPEEGWARYSSPKIRNSAARWP
jgi:hypothetical protein